MSPDRDDRKGELETETYEEEPPRSIFAATWFRAVLILIVLGVIGAVAVPYILDAVNPPPTQQAVVKSAPLPAAPSSPLQSPSPSPSQPAAGPITGRPADNPSPAPPAPRSTPPSTAAMSDTAKPAAPAAKPPGPLAKADVPTAKPAAPAAKTEQAAPKTDAPVKSSVSKSPAVTTDSTAKKTAADTSARTNTKPAAKKPPEPRPVVAKTATPAATGAYWVQVGAFKDEETAKRLAARLREQNFKVADVAGSAPAPAASASTPAPTASPSPPATPTPAGADQYDVFVTGLPPAELNTRLTAKGLAAETSGNGVVIKPSLPLRDAVALSKDLAVEGFKVQVRRAVGAGAPRAPARPQPPTSAAAKAPEGDGLYRVRVGAFADRAAAMAALRELEANGYKPFIARGER